ncbi:hypothetical protein K474DRAFT_1678280 [Panus rudis PR-1116 ss-1]|nr:hypothetical protein K474DRAFT_1678280 [Panus rudis PR-1116 ss-1]
MSALRLVVVMTRNRLLPTPTPVFNVGSHRVAQKHTRRRLESDKPTNRRTDEPQAFTGTRTYCTQIAFNGVWVGAKVLMLVLGSLRRVPERSGDVVSARIGYHEEAGEKQKKKKKKKKKKKTEKKRRKTFSRENLVPPPKLYTCGGSFLSLLGLASTRKGTIRVLLLKAGLGTNTSTSNGDYKEYTVYTFGEGDAEKLIARTQAAGGRDKPASD